MPVLTTNGGAQGRKTTDDLLNEVISNQRLDFKEYRVGGNRICQILWNELSQRLSMDRSLIAGSIGKRTWLGKGENPDFDVVLLLNRAKPGEKGLTPEEVIDRIVAVVSSLPRPFCYLKHSKFTVTCSYKEYEFDIVPGFNFITNTGKDPHHELTQLDRTWKNIVENNGDLKRPFISASLAEYVVAFVDEQDEFVHDIIMLAKLWTARRMDENVIGEIKGRSFTMELIAIKVANEEKDVAAKANPDNPEKNWTRAFANFLRVFLLQKSQVNIVFPFEGSKTQETAYEQYLKMARSGGVILDPANPWNNLLDNFTDRQWFAFSDAARHSLAWIEQGDDSILDCFQ